MRVRVGWVCACAHVHCKTESERHSRDEETGKTKQKTNSPTHSYVLHFLQKDPHGTQESSPSQALFYYLSGREKEVACMTAMDD